MLLIVQFCFSHHHIFLDNVVVFLLDKEIARLEKELDKLQKELDRVDKKLSNENFVNKAPEKVINEEKEKQLRYQEKYDGVKNRIEQLNSNI
jgi:valyl-tRNA synthetase